VRACVRLHTVDLIKTIMVVTCCNQCFPSYSCAGFSVLSPSCLSKYLVINETSFPKCKVLYNCCRFCHESYL
jgi:hypothetical protein